jgi:hypothetical protein
MHIKFDLIHSDKLKIRFFQPLTVNLRLLAYERTRRRVTAASTTRLRTKHAMVTIAWVKP